MHKRYVRRKLQMHDEHGNVVLGDLDFIVFDAPHQLNPDAEEVRLFSMKINGHGVQHEEVCGDGQRRITVDDSKYCYKESDIERIRSEIKVELGIT